MMMALNRHMLHNSLLKVQQHISLTSSSTLKIAGVTSNNGLNHTLKRSNSFQQSSSDSEDDTLKKNPYYSSYAEKLKAFKRKDTDGYKEALQQLRTKNQKINNAIDSITETTAEVSSNHVDSTPIKMHPKSKRRPSQTLLVKPKTLDQIMNIDLLLNKSWRDISEIWLAYHKNRDETLSAVIPLTHFNTFYNQSIKYPMFILPLPRNNGYEFMFIQFQHFQEHKLLNCSVHITPLISYQTYNENAPECMTVEYYTDLCNSDKINNTDSNDESCVLMRATYDGKLLSAVESSCLVNQLRIFYQADSGNTEKEKLLKLFNEGDAEFQHADVISCVETLSL
ncbi:ATP11 [Cinara cedri]|uniref:ATP11 n=1 Tax=Cinara cedri TaxID=506608 RepID=A0A5E4NLN7_9HEMI|nr:ATP11 [Cinara cedri]